MQNKGHSQESAKNICGAMQQQIEGKVITALEAPPSYPFERCLEEQRAKGADEQTAIKNCNSILKKGAQIVEKFTNAQGNKFFVRAFLIDDSLNLNKWAVTKESISRNINTFIGKPLVLTETYDHPGANEEGKEQNLNHWLEYQEVFRVGSIIDIVEKANPSTGGTAYYAIIEVTNPNLQQSLRDNSVPLYVSPAIAEFPRGAAKSGTFYNDPASAIQEWTGVHLAIVDEPAYSVKKAVINQTCGGDKEGCLLQLRKAHLARFGAANCGFCVKKALNKLQIIHEARISKNNTSQGSSSTTTKNSKSMSQLENIDSTNSATDVTQQNNNNVDQTAVQHQQQQFVNKQPIQTGVPPQIPATFGDLMNAYQRLQDENKLLKIKNEELGNVKDTLGERIAVLETQSRKEAIERIITADIIKDPKQRIEKIKYFVATTIPLNEIEELYKDIKITLRKASVTLNSSRVGKVPYLSGSSVPTIADNEETGQGQGGEMTPLQKQLAILEGGY